MPEFRLNFRPIGHIAVVTLGLFSNNLVGIVGSVMLGLGHGFVSPALFVLTGGVLYDRFHTRAIYYYRGMAQYMPIFSVLFFIGICCNIGVPTTVNWLGEFFCLVGLASTNMLVLVLASMGIIFSAVYSVWLFVRLNYGAYSLYLTHSPDITRREFYAIVYLLLPPLFLGIYAEPLGSMVNSTLSSLLW